MNNIISLSCTLGLTCFLSACGTVETLVNVEKKTGYFVSNFNSDIDYSCKNERKSMNDNGKFECASFPISFYMDKVKIGEISTIHSDGYVYPQDIIVIEDRVPTYASEGNMSFLVVE